MRGKVNLEEKLARISAPWDPKIVAELNGQHVKLVKLKGAFVWHAHESEDELFLVVRGHFTMHFHDHDVELSAGELIVVPRGVSHCPEAVEEAEVLLFEPASTVNTGDASGVLTVPDPGWI